MKIKVALAKYLAWVILVILAALLAFAAMRLGPEAGFTKLQEEIGRYETTVRRGMAETTAPQKPTPDYVGALKTRFEHPAELDRFRHNPFVSNTIVEYPPIQFVKDQTRVVTLKGLRLTEQVPAPETYVKVVEIKWIPEEETSVVTFKAIAPGEAAIQILTTDEVVSYLFTFSVLKVPIPDTPLPPVDVTIVARQAKEIRGRTERALVLITFSPDNRASPPGGPKIGPSNQAAIYRKGASASDAEYVLLKQILPAKAADLQMIWKRFYPEEEVPREGAPPPRPAAPVEAPVPEAALGQLRTPGAEQAATARPQAGAFVYLDNTVEEGESYIYKIVTLNVQPGLQTAECKDPYIRLPPILVPSLVDFVVASAGNGRAKLTLTRLDPENGQPISWTGTFTVGMKIGGIVPGRLTRPNAVGNKDVDFSTGYTLVDALVSFKDISYTSVRLTRTALPVWVARNRLVNDQTVLYLTPVGNALRLRSKSEAAASAPPPPGPP